MLSKIEIIIDFNGPGGQNLKPTLMNMVGSVAENLLVGV